MNCQSISENKSAFLSETTSELPVCCSDRDLAECIYEKENRVVLSSFLSDGYNISHVPQPTRGGVGFVYKDHYHVRLDTSFEFSSF